MLSNVNKNIAGKKWKSLNYVEVKLVLIFSGSQISFHANASNSQCSRAVVHI